MAVKPYIDDFFCTFIKGYVILKKFFHISLSKDSERWYFSPIQVPTRPNMHFTSWVIPIDYYYIHSCYWLFSPYFLFSFSFCKYKKIAVSHATLNRIINTKVSLPRRFFIINFSKSRLPRNKRLRARNFVHGAHIIHILIQFRLRRHRKIKQ